MVEILSITSVHQLPRHDVQTMPLPVSLVVSINDFFACAQMPLPTPARP